MWAKIQHQMPRFTITLELEELAEDGALGFLAPDPLPNDYQAVPYFFIGDDAFAL